MAFWSWLWSIMGVLLAVPMLVALCIVCEHITRLEGVEKFLSARGDKAANDAPCRAARPLSPDLVRLP